ncbi:MAG: ABC transporter ATP-binding protein, partial [Rhodopirellula sp. JB053]
TLIMDSTNNGFRFDCSGCPGCFALSVGLSGSLFLARLGRDRFRAATIGYVFQTFNLLPAFSAVENVKLGMTFGSGRVDSERALDLLDRVGLADRANYRPNQLSVGQQQRVAIARALAGRPKLLLADEPTANVDPASADSVLDLIIDSCRSESIALLMVTHSMDVADRFERIERLEDINRIPALKQS